MLKWKKRAAKKVAKKGSKLEQVLTWGPLIGIVLLVLAFSIVDRSKIAKTAKKNNEAVTLYSIDNIPKAPTRIVGAAPNNWRAPELSSPAFKKFLIANDIQNVYRLNGDGKDSKKMSKQDMKWICMQVAKEYGRTINFHYLNIEPYCDGNTKAIEQIVADLEQGNTYVSCKHGVDRTGSVVARYMLKLGYSLKDILYHNNWIGYIERKGEKYRKYLLCALEA